MRLLVSAAAALLALEAGPLYGTLTANSRLSPALQQRLRQDLPVYSVMVTFPFRPEFFHINKLQQIGTVAGVEGSRIRVFQVTAAQVREIAGFYWIKQVDVLEGGP
ncbi:MAG TPA: hypothetical protein VGX75_00390 [bacterium]|nr:hypothetical protein [bacterium]